MVGLVVGIGICRGENVGVVLRGTHGCWLCWGVWVRLELECEVMVLWILQIVRGNAVLSFAWEVDRMGGGEGLVSGWLLRYKGGGGCVCQMSWCG